MKWLYRKGSKDLLKTSLKSTDLLLAREVKYKNWHSNSYQFGVVSKDQLGQIKSKHLYEVIVYKPEYHTKLFFDLDTAIDIPGFCKALYDLGITEIIILDACEVNLPFPSDINSRILAMIGRVPKFSVHIICNRVFESVYHVKSWIIDVFLVQYPNFKIDLTVYTKDRLMRLTGLN